MHEKGSYCFSLTAVQSQSADLASCDAASVAELYIEQRRFADLDALDLHKLELHSSLIESFPALPC